MREAILAVSFGSTVDQARSRDLEGVEQALSAAAPELPLFRAYTSGLVRARLGDWGIAVPDVAGALEQMAAEGIECPLIVPTHLLPGAEYDKIRETAARWEGRFPALRLSRPLLGTPEDLRELGGALMDLIPPAEGAQTLFMGHGTHRSADLVYPALQGIFHLAGRDDLVVATVEGRPRVEEVLPLVTAPAVELVPLMLVAGDHALHDMAGEGPDSWKRLLQSRGHAVSCRLTGLGALPQVQALYVRRLEELRAGS